MVAPSSAGSKGRGVVMAMSKTSALAGLAADHAQARPRADARNEAKLKAPLKPVAKPRKTATLLRLAHARVREYCNASLVFADLMSSTAAAIACLKGLLSAASSNGCEKSLIKGIIRSA